MVLLPIVRMTQVDYKASVKYNRTKYKRQEQGDGLFASLQMDLDDFLGWSEISDRRKHFYVYSLLVLLILLGHVLKHCT